MSAKTGTLPEGYISSAQVCFEILRKIQASDGVPPDTDEVRRKWTDEDWHAASMRQVRAYDLLYRMICHDDGVPALPIWTRSGPHVPPEMIDPAKLGCRGWHNHSSLGSGNILAFTGSELSDLDGWPLFILASDWNATRQRLYSQYFDHWEGASTIDTPLAPSKPNDEKCKELAASFDDERIAKRDVKAQLIASRWNSDDGPVPKKEDITSRMSGQPRGRRAES